MSFVGLSAPSGEAPKPRAARAKQREPGRRAAGVAGLGEAVGADESGQGECVQRRIHQPLRIGKERAAPGALPVLLQARRCAGCRPARFPDQIRRAGYRCVYRHVVSDAEIVISSEKLAKIQNKHPAMSDDVIRQIPDVIENPVVIMKSRTVDGRVAMFGNVVDDAGVPVLAVISIDPQKNMVAGVNFIRMNSAYGKNKAPQDFINRSEILYVDKNRASDWAVSTGLQLPVDLTPEQGSYNNIVQQPKENVNREIDEAAENRWEESRAQQKSQKKTIKAEESVLSSLQTLAGKVGVGLQIKSDRRFGRKGYNPNANGAGYYINGERSAVVRSKQAGKLSVTGHEGTPERA